MLHPAQRRMAARVTQLITWLHSCQEPNDYNEFQRYLFRDLHSVEERRGQCARIVKRLRRGQTLPADLPEPPPNGRTSLADWQFEEFVFARLARQLRTVGDGLAWQSFGFDRRVILTLSRNAPAGPMYKKDGLPWELGTIESLWNDKHHFTLLHDLTNCLRIADVTEFTADGGALLREVKASGRTDRRQMERIQTAISAIMENGSLPGGRPDARLVELAIPYETDLKKLKDLIDLARYHGARGMRLTPGRALFAVSIEAADSRWGDDPEAALPKLDSIRANAIKRAGIKDAAYHIRGISGDLQARSPIMAPWSIYPLPAEDCGALACDLLMFELILSPEAIAIEAERAGLGAEVLLTREGDELSGEQNVLRLSSGDKSITLHATGLNLLLYELVQPAVWVAGMKEALSNTKPPAEPVMVFANEAATWRV